jgi:hypothetical protein
MFLGSIFGSREAVSFEDYLQKFREIQGTVPGRRRAATRVKNAAAKKGAVKRPTRNKPR